MSRWEISPFMIYKEKLVKELNYRKVVRLSAEEMRGYAAVRWTAMSDTKKMVFRGLARHAYIRLRRIRRLLHCRKKHLTDAWRQKLRIKPSEESDKRTSMAVLYEPDLFYMEIRQQWLLRNPNLLANRFSIISVVPLGCYWTASPAVMVPSEISVLTFKMFDGIKDRYSIVVNSGKLNFFYWLFM
ncbi:unnamed protein product [Soboliphyme baturini]|uniref:IQ motif containing M n=1 Tax=Soboliphyme baturini TaxID=241478 RepID=A0A183J5T3_9BILA|nr:unnamed protein product [Soboliphyme baturini]